MRLALLGIDSAVIELVAAAQSAGHEVVCAYLDEGGPALQVMAPSVQPEEHWEGLLYRSDVSAVLVARGDHDARAEQLRKLAAEQKAMLLSHPVHSSMLLHFELDMIRQESGCRLVPYIPSRWNGATHELKSLVDAGELGALEQIVVERSMTTRTRQEVQRLFALDVDLLSNLAGPWSKLGALGSGQGAARYANLGVQLAGPRGVVARWSLQPGEIDQARLEARGTQGRATVRMPPAGAAWELLVEGRSGTGPPRCFPADDVPRKAIEALQLAVRGQYSPDMWLEASRSVELAETIDRSLDRGRVIELHHDDFSEESTFKGTMAAMGCGLLLVAAIVMATGSVAGYLGLGIADYWPHTLLLTLGLFLGVQFFLRLARRREKPGAAESKPSG
jgi:hypothetical protein